MPSKLGQTWTWRCVYSRLHLCLNIAYCVTRQRDKNYRFSRLQNTLGLKWRLNTPFPWRPVKLFTTNLCYATTTATCNIQYNPSWLYQVVWSHSVFCSFLQYERSWWLTEILRLQQQVYESRYSVRWVLLPLPLLYAILYTIATWLPYPCCNIACSWICLFCFLASVPYSSAKWGWCTPAGMLSGYVHAVIVWRDFAMECEQYITSLIFHI